MWSNILLKKPICFHLQEESNQQNKEQNSTRGMETWSTLTKTESCIFLILNLSILKIWGCLFWNLPVITSLHFRICFKFIWPYARSKIIDWFFPLYLLFCIDIYVYGQRQRFLRNTLLLVFANQFLILQKCWKIGRILY